MPGKNSWWCTRGPRADKASWLPPQSADTSNAGAALGKAQSPRLLSIRHGASRAGNADLALRAQGLQPGNQQFTDFLLGKQFANLTRNISQGNFARTILF